MTSPDTPAAPAAPPSNYTFFVTDAVRLVRVLFSPGAVFEELNADLKWVGAWLVLGLVTAVLNILNAPFQQRVGQIMAERAGRTVPAGAGMSAVRMAIGFVTSPLVVLIIAAILAVVLFMFVAAFGGESSYKRALTVVLYAWPIALIQQILTFIILKMRGLDAIQGPQDMMVSLGVDLLLPADMHLSVFMRLLLAGLSPLLVWTAAIIAVGAMVLGKTSKGASWMTAVCYCLVTLLITSALFSFFLKMAGIS